jgi:hypothetical protein
MDRKTIIILVCCVAGMLLLNRLVDKIYPPIPIPPSATNSPSATTVSNATGSVTGEVASGAVAIPNVPLPTFSTNIDEQLLVVTNQDARLIFSSLGGGLKEMELFHHRADVSRHARKRSLTNGFASLNEHGAVPVLTVSGGDSLQGDGVFALSRTEVGVPRSCLRMVCAL